MKNKCLQILIFFLLILPLNRALAEGFVDSLLRFTGISISTSKTRAGEPSSFLKGNLWLIKIDESGAKKAQQITIDKTYRSPLWIPDSNKIIAVKENKLIQLNNEGGKEKTLHNLSVSTILLGFDKIDSNTVLVLQDLLPALLSLSSGKITLLPHNKESEQDRDALDNLTNSFRDYGNTEVFIKEHSRVDANGSFKKINKIHINSSKQKLDIPCSGICAQPALIEGGQQLVFIGH